MKNVDKLLFLQTTFPNKVFVVHGYPILERIVNANGKHSAKVSVSFELHVNGLIIPLDGDSPNNCDEAIDIAWLNFFGDVAADSAELPAAFGEAV